NLTTAPAATTNATITSPPGYYNITVANGVSSNYNFIYINGRLTVLPETGNTQPYIQAYLSGPNKITVKVYSPEADLGDVVLYSLSGQPMLKRNVFLPQGFITFDLPVSSSLNGVYVVYVYGRKMELKKMIRITR
ncbi:MAG TPA: MBG domain-containing protein, partial [Chitinophagaceae bacterium]